MPKVHEVRAKFEKYIVRCKHGEGCKMCCWDWKGATRKNKPIVIIKKQSWTVGSVAWRLYHGKKPSTRLLSLCQNNSCTNPLHWDTYHSDEVISERFWSKVARCDHGWECGECCWPWVAGKNSDGYGNFTHKGHTINAPRVSWVLYWNKGVFPKREVETRHSCHNRACCNPNHLSKGSHLENMEDRSLAGRSASKLCENDVRDIRTLYATGRYSENRLAVKFEVGLTTIHHILTRHLWTHVKDLLQPQIDVALKHGRDRIRSGRTYTLTPESVKRIRVLYSQDKYSQDQLAERYNVSKHQIGNILRGIQWRDVGGPLATDISEQLGEKNVNSVLNPDKVRQIRILGTQHVPQRTIATQFGVSQRTVTMILNGLTWAHVICHGL